MLFARTKVVKQNFAGPVLENGDHMLMEQDVTGKPTVKFKLKCADGNMYTILFFHISYKFLKLDLI